MIKMYRTHNIVVRPAEKHEGDILQKLNILAFKDRGQAITPFDQQILAGKCPANIDDFLLYNISYGNFLIAEVAKPICQEYPLQTTTGKYAVGYIETTQDAYSPDIYYIENLYTRAYKRTPAGCALMHAGISYMLTSKIRPRKIKLDPSEYAYDWYLALGYKRAPDEERWQLLHSQFAHTMHLLGERLGDIQPLKMHSLAIGI